MTEFHEGDVVRLSNPKFPQSRWRGLRGTVKTFPNSEGFVFVTPLEDRPDGKGREGVWVNPEFLILDIEEMNLEET